MKLTELPRALVRLLSSFGLSCVLLLLLGLLTWLGTLEQVHTGLYEVQKKYFESFLLWHDFGPISLPLPGANLVLCVLFVNLLVGGLIRLRRESSRLGVATAHIGIMILLVSGFVKTYFSDEGHVTLFEGQSARHYQSYYLWELAVLEDLGQGRVREHVSPQARFAQAASGGRARLTSAALPFDLVVDRLYWNCEPMSKEPKFATSDPVVEGVFLDPRPKETEAEANLAGAYVTVRPKSAQAGATEPVQGILWGAQSHPWTVEVAGKRYAIDLRKERYPLGFELELDDFTKIDHAGTTMARSFSSEVTVREEQGTRPVLISMNEPLRTKGLVLYQASWGPANARPGQPLFSTFAVVRNPADRAPLIGCIVITIGMVWHFGRKLLRHVRVQRQMA
jgi:hypothetical protein